MSTRTALEGFNNRVQSGEYRPYRRTGSNVPMVTTSAGEQLSLNDLPVEEKRYAYFEVRTDPSGNLSVKSENNLTLVETSNLTADRLDKLRKRGWFFDKPTLSPGHVGFGTVDGTLTLGHKVWKIRIEVSNSYEPSPVTVEPVPVVETNLSAIPDGTYTVVRGDEYRTLKIKTTTPDSAMAGKRIIALLTGPDNTTDFTGFGFVEGKTVRLWRAVQNSEWALKAKEFSAILLEGDFKEAGEVYAMKSGRCCKCGRKLTVPTSLHNGMGPDCFAKAGGF